MSNNLMTATTKSSSDPQKAAPTTTDSTTDSTCKLAAPTHSINNNYAPATTQQQQNSTVDFIVKSPYDILCRILYYLDLEQLCECVQVNPSWFIRLQDCPEPWRNIQFSDVDHIRLSTSKILYETAVPVVSEHVYTIDIQYIDTPELVTDYLKLLQTCSFSNLQSLIIQGGHVIADNKNEKMNMIDELYTSLTYVSQTLEELAIIWQQQDAELQLGRLLSLCPNLIFFSCVISTITDFHLSRTARLRTLHLFPENRIHVTHEVKMFFQQLPQLYDVTINNVISDNSNTYDDLSPTFRNHCSKLSKIWINPLYFKSLLQIDNNPAPSVPEGSLESVIIHPFCSAEPLTPYLDISHDSLQQLCLAPSSSSPPTITTTCWKPLSSHIFSNLTYLHIRGENTTHAFLCDELPRMLRCYPALETFVFENYFETQNIDSPGPDHVFNTLTELSQLQRLHLTHVDVRGPGLKQLLDHYATVASTSKHQHEFDCAYGNVHVEEHKIAATVRRSSDDKNGKRKLRELSLNRCFNMRDDMLVHIAKITSLEKLRIYRAVEGASLDPTGGIDVLTQSISKNMPRLVNLDLGGIRFNSTAESNMIDRCCTLTSSMDQDSNNSNTKHILSSLTLRDVSGISRESIKKLQDNVKQIKIYSY